ncbi:hypothetical protein ZHAS_00012902 [Anopheles sinensis]|uniref:Uncharacterized protein n=1 Tax=Anopheles sinensis TaxID=74873 RepID=A0A084W424_ANOSI|nr:hypothetical protein ZHAS_00012902 [Anopheles sinensis]
MHLHANCTRIPRVAWRPGFPGRSESIAHTGSADRRWPPSYPWETGAGRPIVSANGTSRRKRENIIHSIEFNSSIVICVTLPLAAGHHHHQPEVAATTGSKGGRIHNTHTHTQKSNNEEATATIGPFLWRAGPRPTVVAFPEFPTSPINPAERQRSATMVVPQNNNQTSRPAPAVGRQQQFLQLQTKTTAAGGNGDLNPHHISRVALYEWLRNDTEAAAKKGHRPFLALLTPSAHKALPTSYGGTVHRPRFTRIASCPGAPHQPLPDAETATEMEEIRHRQCISHQADLLVAVERRNASVGDGAALFRRSGRDRHCNPSEDEPELDRAQEKSNTKSAALLCIISETPKMEFRWRKIRKRASQRKALHDGHAGEGAIGACRG